MIISKTPLRISFVGGGTDLPNFYKENQGMVISSAINKYIYVIVKERYDNLIVLNYTSHEIVENIQDIKHDLIRECLLKVGIKNGIEITTLADIPSTGSGLGSSSTVTVGLLNALYHYIGISISAERLAQEACQIEIEILKKPIGKQDQYIAAYGGVKKIMFNKDESVSVEDILINSMDRIRLCSNILLHFTKITRNADKILTQQKANNKTEFLIKIANLVPQLEESFRLNNLDNLGKLLQINWELKKELADGISVPEIDAMTELAKSNGATGYKIAGAGGGGFLMSYVPRDKQDDFRKGMNDYRELPFMFDQFGSRIIFNIQ